MSEVRDLEETRTEIDSIDRQLLALFCRRMELANDVAAYKQAHGLPVLRPEREQEILEWAAEQSGPEFREFAVRLFGEVMRLSREYQDFLLKEWKKKETSE